MNNGERLDSLIRLITSEMDERAAAIEARLNARLTAQQELIAGLVAAVEALQARGVGKGHDGGAATAAQASVIVDATKAYLRRNLAPIASRLEAVERGQR